MTWDMGLYHPFAYLEGTHQRFVDRHHAPSIVEFSTVVWGREQSNELSLGEELIAWM